MTRHIPVPTFGNLEEAAAYAKAYKPMERARTAFQHNDVYRQLYGEQAYQLAKKCWESARDGRQSDFWRASRALCWALPDHVFEGYKKRPHG